MSNVVLRRLGPNGGVGCITLSRPESLNTISLSMVRSINMGLKEWLTCPSLKCLLLRGEGTKTFCAGGDVKSLYTDKSRVDVQDASSLPMEVETQQLPTNTSITTLCLVAMPLMLLLGLWLVAAYPWWYCCCHCNFNSSNLCLSCRVAYRYQQYIYILY